MKKAFLDALETVEAAFGDHAFRRYVPESKTWRRPILAALFDAQMFAALSWDRDRLTGHSDRIKQEYEDSFSDAEFRRTIDAATNTPALFKKRIEITQGIFARSLSS